MRYDFYLSEHYQMERAGWMKKGVSLEIGNYCTFSALFNQVNP